jgi:heat shock protein HslJ
MINRFLTARYAARAISGSIAHMLAIALVMAGCTGTQEAAVETPAPAEETITVQPPSTGLGKTDWQAIGILGRAADSADSTLSFLGAGQVAGNGGCNAYQGGVTLEDNHIEFGPLATTRMMCPPPISGQETVFLEALGMARSWEQSDDILELIDEGHEVVLRFTRQ